MGEATVPCPHGRGGGIAGRESPGAQQGSLAYHIFKGTKPQEGGGDKWSPPSAPSTFQL